MKSFAITLTTLMVVLVAYPFSSFATKWRVNNNPTYTNGCTHCFSELQDAVNVVSHGDTIYLEASPIEYGATTVTNKRVVIIGTGYFLNQNVGLQSNPVWAQLARITFDTGSDSSVIKGIAIHPAGGNTAYIDIENASHIVVERCLVGFTVRMNNSAAINGCTIRQCYIAHQVTAVLGPVFNLSVSNCFVGDKILIGSNVVVTGEVQHCVIGNGVTNSPNSVNYFNNIITGTFTQNVSNSTANVYSNLFTGAVPSWLSGGTNISVPASTVFPAAGLSQDLDLKVQPSCVQCFQAFPGSEEFGMFGGIAPYVLSGIPNVPTIYKLESPTNAEQGGTLNVTISTKSNN